MLPTRPGRSASALALLAALLAAPALAQDRGLTYTYNGTPGLLEMPSAIAAVEGEVAGTVAFFQGTFRSAFTAQLTPRVSTTFRFTDVESEDGASSFSDRSFDLRYQILEEGPRRPMLTVGLQGLFGSGFDQAEYVVATKTIGDSFRVTAGLGWGRLGTGDGLGSPFGDRPVTYDPDEGGTANADAWFRGEAAPFAGLEYAATERLTVKLEYSSDDAYVTPEGDAVLERDSPFNVGVSWRPLPGIQLQGAYLYGTELAFGATVVLNLNDRPFGPGLDTPPPPVAVRSEAVRAAQSWDRATEPAVTVAVRDALRTEGVELLGLELGERTARVRYQNTRFRSEAQAMGRVARLLTQTLPPAIETFTLEPSQRGIPLSAATVARSDLERLETRVGGSDAMLAATSFADAEGRIRTVPPVREDFTWALRPYAQLGIAGASGDVQLDLGAELSAAYRFSPNLVLSGALRQEVFSTSEGEAEPVTSDELPVVRRNSGLYGQDGHPVIANLTLAHYSRPGRDLYGRATLGYLERQYAGLSTELLWAPVASPLALGLEVNHVAQRDFEQLFGLQDYEVTTGHASAYYDVGNGFHLQLDAGRYLAGDWGATFAVDREWENGWTIGAYATLTEVPFDVYGEGSFDKGLRVTVPLDFALGRPTRREVGTTFRPPGRDGGARLVVPGRLYDEVREGHLADLEDGWGRFWR